MLTTSNMKKFLVSIILFASPLYVGAVTAVVEIDTGTETINAIEGTLKIPASVSVSDIYTGNSAILIWITEPTLNTKLNEIPFAGLTPSGFRGVYPIFFLAGEFGERDLPKFKFSEVIALKNDGSGTIASVRFRLVARAITEDTVSPEPFVPIVSKSADVFDSRYFISFLAQDKGLGIERYEIAFSWFFGPGKGQWAEIKSPRALSRLNTFQKISIRAVDKAGNFREVSTSGPYRYYLPVFGVIILLCVLLLLRRSFQVRFSQPY